jgi:hypothetical protein
VCDIVTAQAASSETAASGGWASYRVFLSAEVQDLTHARLAPNGPDDAASVQGSTHSQGSPKTRKLDAPPAPAAAANAS